MCKRFLRIQIAISNVLNDLGEKHLNLNSREITICKSIVEALSPITSYVEFPSQKATTMYEAHIGYEMLLDQLVVLESSIAGKLVYALKDRYLQRQNILLYRIQIYLSNFKKFFAMFSDQKTLMCELININIKDIYVNYSSNINENLMVMNFEKNEDKKNEETFFEKLKNINSVKSSNSAQRDDCIENEFLIYENSGVMGGKLLLVLNWFKTIKPTSVESERVFSTSSNIKTKVRNLLSDESLNKLIFLKYWFINNKIY